jgi:hypothetical protein
MFANTETTRSGGLARSCRRSRAAALTAVAAAALLAAGLASASAAPAAVMVVHSAKSGELGGGRLTLGGVGGRVTYAISGGRSGTLTVRRLHSRMFLARKPAIGTLHVAGHRGGDEPTFRLSKPRYNAARRTVSYRARPLANKPLPGSAARAAGFRAPRSFGAASLSIVPHPTVASGDNGGNDCEADIQNIGGFQAAELDLVSSGQWDTDTWGQSPPSSIDINRDADVESDGGLARGCSFTTTWSRNVGGTTPVANITIEVTWPWTQLPSSTCTIDNPQPQALQCRRNDSGGMIVWEIESTSPRGQSGPSG